MSASGPTVIVGLEALVAGRSAMLAGKALGLVTNSSAIDRHLRSAVDVMHASDNLHVTKLFGPEHGVRGDAQDGVNIPFTVDAWTGLPVYSLYGATREPTPDMLDGLDALVFDIQDVPLRFATYLSTLAYAQIAAARARIEMVVLDRPNSLTGSHIEGNVLDPAFASFVGVHPVTVRHGLTVGEFARLFAAERGLPEPMVVTMDGWRRDMWFDDTGLPWVQPSPNLPTLDSVSLYPGTCLIEGTNVSEGRGTTRPFEYVGAPWIDPHHLTGNLERRSLPGVAFRPAFFTPTQSKHTGEPCGGVQIHVQDREALRPAELGVHLLHACISLHGDEFAWRRRESGEHIIDMLAGTDTLRRRLQAGIHAAEIVRTWQRDVAEFEVRRRPYLLYSD
jgi:uncharacterized protein YbbC (DUF1343 family)